MSTPKKGFLSKAMNAVTKNPVASVGGGVALWMVGIPYIPGVAEAVIGAAAAGLGAQKLKGDKPEDNDPNRMKVDKSYRKPK
jgi:hypothetical protein